MTTSPKAEMSTSAAQRNIRRLNDYNDLINFEPREYDNGYTSPRYQGDICRPFIPIPTQYEYHISNEEEEDDCIIVVDSDDVQVSRELTESMHMNTKDHRSITQSSIH